MFGRQYEKAWGSFESRSSPCLSRSTADVAGGRPLDRDRPSRPGRISAQQRDLHARQAAHRVVGGPVSEVALAVMLLALAVPAPASHLAEGGQRSPRRAGCRESEGGQHLLLGRDRRVPASEASDRAARGPATSRTPPARRRHRRAKRREDTSEGQHHLCAHSRRPMPSSESSLTRAGAASRETTPAAGHFRRPSPLRVRSVST